MTIREPLLAVWTILFIPLSIISLIIHSLTYLRYDPHEISLALWWGLQFSSAFAFIVGIIASGAEDMFFGREKIVSQRPPILLLDRRLAACFVFFMFYGFFNFLFTRTVLLNNQTAEVIMGQYVMGSHGSFTPVSTEVFMKAMVYEARASSGHWMAFFLFAVTALRSKAQKRTPISDEQQILYKPKSSH
jgi:hypothetical protein